MSEQMSELFTGQFEGNTQSKDRAYPVFYVKTVENENESKKEGRAVFKQLEYVKIKTFDKTLEVDCPVEEVHKRRWPRNYQAFKEGAESPIDGTPIQQWPLISEMRRMELNSMGIRSVEDLADFPDGDIPHRSNLHDLKKRARDWLKEAKGLGVLSSLRTKSEQLEAENVELREALKKMNAKIDVLEDMQRPHEDAVINPVQVEPPKKKPGRPRKS